VFSVLQFEQKFETEDGTPPVTKIDKSNPWWVTLKETLEEKINGDFVPTICPASTDMRFLRQKGVPAFGFTTIMDTPILIHDHNEVSGFVICNQIHFRAVCSLHLTGTRQVLTEKVSCQCPA
jgi:hypothetical protein